MSTTPGFPSSRGRRFTAGRIAIFLIIVAGFMAWQGSQKIPLGAASGTSFVIPAGPPASRPSGDVLRVATFNIDGKTSTPTIDTISGFDLIGLQEVHGSNPLSKFNQAEILGRKSADAGPVCPRRTPMVARFLRRRGARPLFRSNIGNASLFPTKSPTATAKCWSCVSNLRVNRSTYLSRIWNATTILKTNWPR